MRPSIRAARTAVDTALLLLRAVVSTSVSHWALSLFSIASAFALWFVVQDVENPRSQGVVPIEGELPIEVEGTNLPEGVVVGTIGTVQVLVEAREADLPGLHRDDFAATVDLSGLRAGDTASLPVSVTTTRSGVQVLGVVPATLEVTATETFEKSLQVTLLFDGELPVGFESDGPAEIQPTLVTVSGDRSQVEFVNTVEALITISGLRDTETFDSVPLVARTASGSRVTNVTLSVPSVTVTYPVTPIFASKTVPVEVDFTGVPADGYAVSSVSVTPDRVAISGNESFVESVESLHTVPVDITGAKASFTGVVALTIPDNISPAVTDAEVSITIVPIQATAVIWVAPTFVGLPAGLAVDQAVVTIAVTVTGPVEQIAELSQEALVVTVALDGLDEGTHEVVPTVTPPDGIEAETPAPVELTLIPSGAGG